MTQGPERTNYDILAAMDLVLAALTTLITLSWYQLFASSKPSNHAALQTLVMLLAQVVSTSLLLGWFGLLNGSWLAILNALVLLGVWLTSNSLITTKGQKDGQWPPLLLCLLFIALLLLDILICIGSQEISTDGIWYHSPYVLLLKQHQGFTTFHNPVFDAYQPRNIELWFHWIFLIFGRESLMRLGQLLFIALLFLSVQSICLDLKCSRRASYCASFSSLFAPIIFAQLSTTYVDLGVSALLCSALALFLACRTSFKQRDVFVFAAALGLLCGAKLSGLIYALALVLLVSPFLLRKIKVSALTCSAVIFAALGLPYFARNMLRFHNPFFPYKLNLGPIQLPGLYETSALWENENTAGLGYLQKLINSWSQIEQIGYAWPIGGLGLVWWLMFTSLPLALFAAWRSRNRNFFLITCAFLLFFLVTPFNYVARFTIFLLAAGAITLAFTLGHLLKTGFSRLLYVCLIVICCLGVTKQALVFARYQRQHYPQSHKERCEKFAFPEDLRAIFGWIESNPELSERLVLISSEGKRKLEPFAFLCLWNSSFSNEVTFREINEPLDTKMLESATVLIVPQNFSAPPGWHNVFSGTNFIVMSKVQT